MLSQLALAPQEEHQSWDVVCREPHTQCTDSVVLSISTGSESTWNQRSGSAAPALAGALAAAAPELLRSTSLVSASWMFSSSSRFIREKSAAILVRVRVRVRVRVSSGIGKETG